jgi:hypothetical protein
MLMLLHKTMSLTRRQRTQAMMLMHILQSNPGMLILPSTSVPALSAAAAGHLYQHRK